MFQLSSPGKPLIAADFRGCFFRNSGEREYHHNHSTDRAGLITTPSQSRLLPPLLACCAPSGTGVAPAGVGSLTQATGFAFAGNPEEEAELLEANV